MTQEEKLRYFKMAASFCNFAFDEESIELIVSMYELVLKKEGDTDLDSMDKVKTAIAEKYEYIRIRQKREQWNPVGTQPKIDGKKKPISRKR